MTQIDDLLIELARIWKEADFGEDDMSADLGERLLEIQRRVEDVMRLFGWPLGALEEWEDPDE